MTRIAVVVLAALALAGCIKPQVVKVPVSVPCLTWVPERPVYEFGRGPMPAPDVAAKMLAKDFERADLYGQEWEAAAAGCLILRDQ